MCVSVSVCACVCDWIWRTLCVLFSNSFFIYYYHLHLFVIMICVPPSHRVSLSLRVCLPFFFGIFYFLTCYNATFFDCFRLCFLSTFDLPFLVAISKSALTWEMQLRCSTWYRWVESPPPTMHSPTIYLHIIRCLLRFSPPFSFTYFSLW